MMTSALRLVFWETTKACNLSCRHCRAVPDRSMARGELTTSGAFDLIDRIAEAGRPVLVLSGGEPLFRPDLYDIAAYGVESGLRVVLASNGALIICKHHRRQADECIVWLRREAPAVSGCGGVIAPQLAPATRGMSGRTRAAHAYAGSRRRAVMFMKIPEASPRTAPIAAPILCPWIKENVAWMQSQSAQR